jgi:hypothetical protein
VSSSGDISAYRSFWVGGRGLAVRLQRRPTGRTRGGSAARRCAGEDIGREGHHAGKNSKQEGGHHEENTTEEEEEGVPFVNPAIPPSSVVL